jgi:hypothetical protein
VTESLSELNTIIEDGRRLATHRPTYPATLEDVKKQMSSEADCNAWFTKTCRWLSSEYGSGSSEVRDFARLRNSYEWRNILGTWSQDVEFIKRDMLLMVSYLEGVRDAPEIESRMVGKMKIEDTAIGLVSGTLGGTGGRLNAKRIASTFGIDEAMLADLNKTEIVSFLLRESLATSRVAFQMTLQTLLDYHTLPDAVLQKIQTALGALEFGIKESNVVDNRAPRMKPDERRIDSGFEYDVAISYASEDVDKAGALAARLEEKGVRVFFDRSVQVELWGKDLSRLFRKVYGPKARYVLVLVSKHYAVKNWTDFEFGIARGEAKQREEEFILPVRLDDTSIPGLRSSVAYLSLETEEIEGVVEALLKKLDISQSNDHILISSRSDEAVDSTDRLRAYRNLAFGDNTNWMPWEARPRGPSNEHFWTWWNGLHTLVEYLDDEDQKELLWILNRSSDGIRSEDQGEFRRRYNGLRKRAKEEASGSG